MVDEAEQSESEESSEYEEYSDSEDETGPRLKPVFVRKYIVYKMLHIFMALCLAKNDCVQCMSYATGWIE